ncbi:MAG: Trk family potassium uptake protein [Clostridiales bacterium]|nr:Trk family potassium uptake protein [Clostridiales bacterium]
MAVKKRLSTFQTILLGFAALVLLGALLLMLPISSAEGVVTPFDEAFFTATSAGCVTGLVVHDTATYWSYFGQAVILILIQIGGLGVVTMAAMFSLLSGKKISLMQRSTMQEALSAHQVGGIVKLTRFILIATGAIEVTGALLMMPSFISRFGPRGIWMAFFHSISAFCNAGFDLMGTPDSKYQSLTSFASDPYINIIVMLLITIGGIGFLTWNDMRTYKFKFAKYSLQSKIVLVTSACLVVIPAIYFFFTEYAAEPMGRRILLSLFQTVTTRTAGFNTGDFGAMRGASLGLVMALMLVGGSTGSTAGGMKTTTLAVLIANVFSVFSRKEDTQLFGRRIDSGIVRNAATILMMYITLFFTGAVVISLADGIPFVKALFETASAVGTVGLTVGITPELGLISRAVLVVLMFLGRVGGLTIIFSAFSGPARNLSKPPLEKITVG